MKIGMAYFEFGGRKGVARVASELTTRMAAEGHEVHFHSTTIPENASATRIHFHEVPAINSFNILGLASFAWSGKRSLLQGQYDITHSHGNIIGSDIITAHSCHKAGLQVAQTFGHKRVRLADNLGVADTFRLFLEKRNYGGKQFKKVIAVSEGVKRELVEQYKLSGADITVIHNGVDLEEFNPRFRQTRGKNLREELGIRSDEFVLLFVANEFERKGLDFIIDALHVLRTQQVRLFVLGSDDKRVYEEQAARLGVLKQIAFFGSVSNVNHYYSASNAFLFPTYYEAFSLATLEAAASGLPLLAAKVNGTEELIQEGHNGFFVERDAEHIADKIRLLVDDENLASRIGNNARHSAEGYSWDTITQKTLQVYKQVC